MIKIISYSFILALLLNSKLLFSQNENELLTIDDFVDIALENNFNLKLAKNNRAVAKNNNTIGNAGFLPRVDLSASANRTIESTNQEFLDGSTQEVDGAQTNLRVASATLTWGIIDGALTRFTTKKRLNLEEINSENILKSEIQNTVALVKTAFFQTALEQERLALFQSNLALSEERLRITQQKYELGKASRVEFLQAQVDFNTDKSSLINQKELVERSKYNLLIASGVEQEASFDIEYNFSVDSTLQLGGLNEQMERANPELNSVKLSQEISRLSADEINKRKLPLINFDLSYNYSNRQAESGFSILNRSNGVRFGVSTNWNVFNGFDRDRQLQNARVQIESDEVQYERLKNELSNNLKATYLTYKNNLDLLNFEKQNIEVAKENREIADERFRVGVSDALEIREAQTNAVNAEIRYLEALLNAKLAEIELKRLSGAML